MNPYGSEVTSDMYENDSRIFADPNNAGRAARLLRFIARRRRKIETAVSKGDQERIQWLKMQLIASRRGAQSAMKEHIAPDEVGETQTYFSDENALYDTFRIYYSTPDPKALAAWVDSLVLALDSLAAKDWDELSQDEQKVISEEIEPLLCRIRELSEQAPLREFPFAIA